MGSMVAAGDEDGKLAKDMWQAWRDKQLNQETP
jgi:hypothetical protein